MGLDTFGRRLNRMRKDLDMTQQELVQAMEEYGVSVGQNYISELERATDGRTPTVIVARAMALALGTSVDYLAMVTDDPASADKRNAEQLAFLTPEADQVGHAIDTLPEFMRTEALNSVRGIQRIDTERQKAQRIEFKNLLNLIEQMFGIETRKRVEAEYIRRIESRLSGKEDDQD